MVRQILVHSPVQGVEQLPPLGLPGGVQPEAVCQPIPVLGAQGHRGMAPEVAPDLGRHLEDHELVGPGREPALAPELADFVSYGHQGVGRGLVGQVIELCSGHPQVAAAPAFAACDPQQHLVEPSGRRFTLGRGARQRTHPLGRLRVQRATGEGREPPTYCRVRYGHKSDLTGPAT